MARVLITGIGGFTGRYVAQALIARGHTVVGMARDVFEPQMHQAEATLIGDLGDPNELRQLIDVARPDRVIHLAAISFVAHGDANAIYQTNLIGTLNLLQALATGQWGRERILLASSANVYGNQGGRLSEETAPFPANHYGASKLAMEHMARTMGGDLPMIIARPFNYTGVGQSPNFIIPKLIDHARRGATEIELGNIDVARDFSDVRTVAECYARLIDCPEAEGHTFNICRGHSLPLRQVISLIEELAEIRFNIRTNPAFERQGEIMDLYGCRARLDAMVGPLQIPELRETLRWMLEV
jgi:nucleoside-diphosphate-sugar epimerase